MNTPPITPGFIHRLAEALGGAVVADVTDEDRDRVPVVVFDVPRCQLHISTAWDARPKWRAWITDATGQCVHNCPSANFDSKRPLPAITADIRRRVLDQAVEPLRQHYAAQMAYASEQELMRQRIAELEAATGSINAPSRYGRVLVLPGFDIQHEYTLKKSDSFTADIRVHSFAALKMIAAICAEDHRLHVGK